MAVVLSVTHKGQPIQDALKLQRLQQMLFDMMDQKHQGIVTIKTVSCPLSCPGQAGTPVRGRSRPLLFHVDMSRRRANVDAAVCATCIADSRAERLKWYNTNRMITDQLDA